MIKLQKRNEPNNTKLSSSENEIMLLHFKSKGMEGTVDHSVNRFSALLPFSGARFVITAPPSIPFLYIYFNVNVPIPTRTLSNKRPHSESGIQRHLH